MASVSSLSNSGTTNGENVRPYSQDEMFDLDANALKSETEEFSNSKVFLIIFWALIAGGVVWAIVTKKFTIHW